MKAESTLPVLRIGILEIQGSFSEHKVALQKASKLLEVGTEVNISAIRHAENIHEELDGIIIPGGESTTMSLFMTQNKMVDPLRKWMQNDYHVTWGTCAGLIMLANQTENQKCGGQAMIGGLDVLVSRNYFGRQVNSFQQKLIVQDEHLLSMEDRLTTTFEGIFIRAPAITNVCNSSVKTLAVLNSSASGTNIVVAVKQKNILGTAFHPELTEDLRWHLYFLHMVMSAKGLIWPRL